MSLEIPPSVSRHPATRLGINATIVLLTLACLAPLHGGQSLITGISPIAWQQSNEGPVPRTAHVQADSLPPDSSGMGSLTSVQISQRMVPGWNIGNSLDAIGGETAWGNPVITQRLIDSVKAAGFRSIRIPVAWSKFTDTAAYTIDTTWLARVEQVITYVLNDSLYAIINEHWDGGWQQPIRSDSLYVNRRLAAIWKQVAIRFRDYGDHLLFAGTNEVMYASDYGTPTKEYYTVQNSFNRTFVSTVRSTGGRNAFRYLLVQGFNTNIDHTVNYFSVPPDSTPGRLLIEVHYYDPYDFTINTGSSIIEWGMYAKDASKTETWANEAYADGQFQKMKTKFIDKGYGVVLGEYGTIARLGLGSALNATYASYRRYYMQYITRSLERHGLVPIYWDNGGTGNFGMGIFNRSTGAQAYPDIVDAVVDTNSVAPVLGVRQDPGAPTEISLAQNYPNPFNPTTKIRFQLPSSSLVELKVYDLLGREVATLVNAREAAGLHEVEFDGSGFPSGFYFYRLQADGMHIARSFVLLR